MAAAASIWMLVGCTDRSDSAAVPAEPQAVYSGVGVSNLGKSAASYLEAQKAVQKFDETRVVVAQIGDWSMTMEELDQKAGRAHLKKLRDVYETRFRALDSVLAAKLYEIEAKDKGLTGRELFEQIVKSVDPAVDAGEFAALPVEERLAKVEVGVRDKIFARHKEYVAELALKHGMKMTMAEPSSLVGAGDLDGAGDGEIVLGKKEGSPFDVEIYTDFTCPHCREVNASVEKLISTYGGRVRFIVRPMISDERLGSRPAAVASYCVYRDSPQHFVSYSNRLFERQETLAAGEDSVKVIAAEMGLPQLKFRDCMSDESIRSAMTNGTHMAMERGIQSTPTVLIDGVPVIGNHDYATYAGVLEQVFSAHKVAQQQKG